MNSRTKFCDPPFSMERTCQTQVCSNAVQDRLSLIRFATLSGEVPNSSKSSIPRHTDSWNIYGVRIYTRLTLVGSHIPKTSFRTLMFPVQAPGKTRHALITTL
jgi:hypothetical protein